MADSASKQAPPTVNIIGSGVLGLTCALELAKDPELSCQVSIITADKQSVSWAQSPPTDPPVQSDFASPWAGAYWQPFVSRPETEEEKRFARWETTAFQELWKISDEDPSIVMKVDCREYYENPLPPDELPWYKDLCPEFRKLAQEELDNLPEGKVDGIAFKTVSLNPIPYLAYLHTKLQAYNVKVIYRRLESAYEAFEGHENEWPRSDIVVNASGLGAAILEGVEDDLVEAIRGQTVLVRPPKAMAFANRDNSKSTYIISRPPTQPGHSEEVVLGGCRQAGNFDLTVDHALAKHILKEAFQIRPDLSRDGTIEGIEILKHFVGLRPGRKTGPRLEAEKIPIAGQDDRNGTLIHCYGVGGGGFQASYGMAQEVKSLLKTSLQN